VGTISNGVYQAPATIASQQTITVTATSAANSAKTATATVTLIPEGLTVAPASASLNGGKTATFTATVSGAANTSVAWSISPQVGTISNGVYQAPATIASQQSITVTAKSVANSAKLATATVTLIPVAVTVGPASASLAAGKSATFSASVTGSSNTAVGWTVTPAVGKVVSGVYTAPATITTAQTVKLVATSVADTTKTASATITLTPTATTPANTTTNPATTTITLPVEVMGANGTTSTVSVTVPSGTSLSGQLTLWMQIHGLKYETEASVQVNNSAWLPIGTGNVTLLGNGAAFGGIGGGFRTLQLTMNLPAGIVTTGTNTVSFRFNATNGVVSGFRVLAFNIQSAGSNLLPASQFVNDDPNSWTPPLTSPSDIAAGLALFQSAALTSPSSGPIKAHCSDCHTIDGRDLKYFNYSNKSIEARSTFHGLTAQQGAQIASYIRSLNLPNPGRPWNPPYQPGPGLDSQPVADWAAGAGLGAVLDSDADMVPFMAPGGSTAGWSATSRLNAREIPTTLQLLDWNSWLPVIHPMDAFGSAFTSSQLNNGLPVIRNILQPNSPTAYKNALVSIELWFSARTTFLAPYSPSEMPVAVYSVAQWQLVKMWELNQDFGLEGMPQVPYGAKADVRGWFSGLAFGTAPNVLHLPATPAIGNGTALVNAYLSLAWYHTQLVQNDGQGTQTGHDPIDYGYALAFVRAVFTQAELPGIMELLEFQIKDLQAVTLNGTGPQAGPLGWHVTSTSPQNMMVFYVMPLWSATSPAQQTTFMQAYTQAWFDQASTYTPQQYYQGGWATATENPATDSWSGTFGGQLWYTLPRLRYLGVSNTLLDQISAWAAKILPQGNWSLNNTASCNPVAGSCITGL
jgi:mono/diheme cytochrome c family protein